LNLEELELRAIKKALKRCEGNVSEAADLLGITRYALYRKMAKNKL
jgi:DNA-binding NtrC family response regulator